MKIEKVNDHQIRCTLTKADLADRELKISELAYGTEKAKSLFRDMMQQASAKFGFEADDIPLMIEAIPLNADCIVLVITKSSTRAFPNLLPQWRTTTRLIPTTFPIAALTTPTVFSTCSVRSRKAVMHRLQALRQPLLPKKTKPQLQQR